MLEHWGKNIPSNLNPDDLKKLLKEVCKANGILKHLFGKELSFLHRTFQEYYAAREVYKKGQDFFEKAEVSIFEQFSKKEWYEITLFLVGMLDDATRLIQQIFLKDSLFAFECLVYAKRMEDRVLNDVTCAVLTGLRESIIPNVCSNMSYLAHRYGLNRICQYFSNSLRKIEKDDDKKRLWEVIDHVMPAFSPQKGMVYILSGDIQKGKDQQEWIPGFWMDKYPVTNASYQKWIEASDVTELPRHWEVKSDEEPLVTAEMSHLPIVDVTYKNAWDYSSYFNKVIPDGMQWKKVLENDPDGERKGVLYEDKLKYLKRNKLEKFFMYYRESDIACAHDLARDLASARDLALDRDLARISDLALARDLALMRASDIASVRASDFASARDLAHDLASARDLARSRVKNLALVPELASVRDHALAHALARNRKFLYGKKTGKHFETAQKAAGIIEKQLKYGWTQEAWVQTFELGKALVDALVAFLEELEKHVPDDLLMALRQPGLLTHVNESSPNSFGICDLVGDVREWTSTKNKEGKHLICGGAWTEEKYDPDREEWRQPDWRDIDLGFRCVCDWDKIFYVKTPEEISGPVEVKTESEEEGE